MPKTRVVGTGTVEERIEHLFSYKGMENLDRAKVDELLRCVDSFLASDRPRTRAEKMAKVLGVSGLSSTRVPLHLSQAKLIVCLSRYGWCLTKDAEEYIRRTSC